MTNKAQQPIPPRPVKNEYHMIYSKKQKKPDVIVKIRGNCNIYDTQISADKLQRDGLWQLTFFTKHSKPQVVLIRPFEKLEYHELSQIILDVGQNIKITDYGYDNGTFPPDEIKRLLEEWNEPRPIMSYVTIEIRGTGDTPNTSIIIRRINDDGFCLITFWTDKNVQKKSIPLQINPDDGLGYYAIAQALLEIDIEINNEKESSSEK